MNDRGMGGHHKPNQGDKEEWLTPPEIIEALGPFDLDPCAPVSRPWPTAAEHYTIEDDGLAQPWRGFVWCNPPYGRKTWDWLEKMIAHGNGIALIFARTETEGFFDKAWAGADAMMFLQGRLFFHHVTGERARHNSGAPSVLLAYGDAAVKRLDESGLRGVLVTGWHWVNTTHGQEVLL